VKNFVKTAVAVGVLGLASSAYAGGTHTIAVSATVAGVCVVTGANQNSTLQFGTIDGSMAGPFAGTWSGGNFRCTAGTAYTVTSDNGLYSTGPGGTANRMALAGSCATATNCIRYTLTSVTSGTGAGMSTNISFGVTGQTTAADIVNAPAGNYADTVVLTVAP
jgi:spore coat protein U-like protein